MAWGSLSRAGISSGCRSGSGCSAATADAEEIEILVDEEEAYERAERQALNLLDQGFHLGGVVRASRDELHER